MSTPKAALLGAIAAWIARIPIRIFLIRGLITENARGFRRFLFRWLEWLTARLCQRSICVAPSLLDFARAEGILGPGQGVVLAYGMSNGIDSGRFDPAAVTAADLAARRPGPTGPIGTTVIGFVGRLARDKGIEDLFNAWKEVRDEFPDAVLLLVGPWEENDKVSQSVRHDLESDPRVVLVGSQHDVAPFYKCMSMFVYPSHGTEGFPNAPMEAAAMALPVIASRVVGCVDAVVDGITGALVPPRDPRALAAAIRRYFKDPELRWEHGRAGRERVVRDFRQELIWEAFYQVYLQALKKEGRRGAGLAPEGGAPSGEDGGVGSAGQAGIGGPSWHPGRARRAMAGAIKRPIDVAAASAGLVVLAPLLAIMAMSIRLMMGRPVLFRQVRPGYRARPFALYKFRTMREAYGPDGTPLPDADRLTRLGRFLRKTSLDELPQLWNVLRGDLSLVGPRPLLMQYLPLYTVEQARRHNVRPGITGWAQVNGRNAISWEEKFRYDIWYIDHWSLWLDLKILAMTLGKVLGRAGISPPGQATMSEFTGIGAGNDVGLQGVTSD